MYSIISIFYIFLTNIFFILKRQQLREHLFSVISVVCVVLRSQYKTWTSLLSITNPIYLLLIKQVTILWDMLFIFASIFPPILLSQITYFYLKGSLITFSMLLLVHNIYLFCKWLIYDDKKFSSPHVYLSVCVVLSLK